MSEISITQSDEYYETYERFMEEYDEGKPVHSITQDIIADYLDEFEEDDGILHGVYFALAKAEWMCGGVSEEMLNKVTDIIQSGANLSFFRELELNEQDIKKRKRNLEKFLDSLMIPRGKTKKRKVPTEKYIPKPKANFTLLPKMKLGDIFAFKVDDKYRVITPVDFRKIPDKGKLAYCYAWGKKYDAIPTTNQLSKQAIIPLGYFSGDEFPKNEELIYIGNLHLPQGLAHSPGPGKFFECWKSASFVMAKRDNLYEDYPEELCVDIPTVLKAVEDYRRNLIGSFE